MIVRAKAQIHYKEPVMALNYFITKNKLVSSEKSLFIPRTVSNETISNEQFIEDVAFGTTLTIPDVMAVLKALERVLVEHLSAGRNVNLDTMTLRVQVKGDFSSSSDSYTSGRNWIDIKINPSELLRKQVEENAKVQKLDISKSMPILDSIQNQSDEGKDTFQKNDLVKLEGSNLKFNKQMTDTGIFLVKEEEGLELRIREYSMIHKNYILFKMPKSIDIGNYKLYIYTKLGEDIIKRSFDKQITIVE